LLLTTKGLAFLLPVTRGTGLLLLAKIVFVLLAKIGFLLLLMLLLLATSGLLLGFLSAISCLDLLPLTTKGLGFLLLEAIAVLLYKSGLPAQAQLYGAFGYNHTLFALPGRLFHEKPSARSTWSPSAIDGWYLGPATNCDR
jgi:hypothetical protein